MELKSFALTFLFIGGAYLMICALYYFQQERLLFIGASADTPPEHPRIQAVQHQVGSVALRGFRVSATHTDTELIALYFGGNAEDVAYSSWPMLSFEHTSVYLMNYRGYGNSEGSPGETELRQDALAHFDWIRERHPNAGIAIIGRSLGCAMALDLAAQRDVAGLVLISPFTSIGDVGAFHFPWLPVKPLLKHPFESVQDARRVKVGALIIAAENDEVIPRKFTDALREELKSPSELHIIPGTNHNSLMGEDLPWQLIGDYLKSLR